MSKKMVPDYFIILVNPTKQPSHARNCFKNKILCKRIIKKPYKSELYFFFFFFLNLVLFNGQDYETQKVP